jgi:hypothetical protein
MGGFNAIGAIVALIPLRVVVTALQKADFPLVDEINQPVKVTIFSIRFSELNPITSPVA